jgi:hypothetical protein
VPTFLNIGRVHPARYKKRRGCRAQVTGQTGVPHTPSMISDQKGDLRQSYQGTRLPAYYVRDVPLFGMSHCKAKTCFLQHAMEEGAPCAVVQGLC